MCWHDIACNIAMTMVKHSKKDPKKTFDNPPSYVSHVVDEITYLRWDLGMGS